MGEKQLDKRATTREGVCQAAANSAQLADFFFLAWSNTRNNVSSEDNYFIRKSAFHAQLLRLLIINSRAPAAGGACNRIPDFFNRESPEWGLWPRCQRPSGRCLQEKVYIGYKFMYVQKMIQWAISFYFEVNFDAAERRFQDGHTKWELIQGLDWRGRLMMDVAGENMARKTFLEPNTLGNCH